MTIATELTDLNNNLILAKASVTNKGGMVGDTGLAGLANEIATIPSGSGTIIEEKDINFYDYDGTLVESWTLAELANKTALPDAPVHEGLTSQGWNWTLAELQVENSKMDVGHIYIPTDGKTHIYVDIDSYHLTPNLAIGLNGTAIVDWGDGTATTTLTGSSIDTSQYSYHMYAAAGSYEVTIDISEGSEGKIRGNDSFVTFLWKGEATQSGVTLKNLTYANQIKKIYLGLRLNIIGGLNQCGVERITMHNDVTFSTEGVRHFYNCKNLLYLALPRSMTRAERACDSCVKLKGISLPGNFSLFGEGAVINSCASVAKLYCTNRATMNNIYSRIVQSCQNLQELKLPASLTIATGYLMNSCTKIRIQKFPDGLATFGSSAILGCTNLWLLDFSSATSIPQMSGNAGTKDDGFIIQVPASLEADWKSATGWSDWAQYIVGV